MALLSRPGKVFTREELLSAAFGEAYEGVSEALILIFGISGAKLRRILQTQFIS